MDEQRKQGTMGPPASNTQSNSNQNQINAGNNNNTNKIPQSLPTTKRIINKIPLDYNKLKQAGLDRKLAEALGKRNFTATSKDDKIQQQQQQQSFSKSQSSTSSSSSTSTLATISGEAATSLLAQQKQQQQQPPQKQQQATTSQTSQRQPAPQPIKKRSIMSNYIEKIVPDPDRSLHVKAMLKNRILNKGKSMVDQSGGTTYTYQTPTTTIVSSPKPTTQPTTSTGTSVSKSKTTNPSSPIDFTVPIAKADLTVRPKKPPVVLNLLNQLPKHRDKCLQLPPTVSNPTSSYIKETSVSPTSSAKSPSPPLIVLENKVLAPNEKIKLSDLRLPTRSMTVTPTTNQSRKIILNADKPKVTQENIAELDKKICNKLNHPNVSPSPIGISSPSSLTPGSSKTKVILNANKLKVSREKLAEIAKEVRQQMKQVEQSPKISTESSPSYQSFSTASESQEQPPGQPVMQKASVVKSLFSPGLSASISTKSLISPDTTVSPTVSTYSRYQQLKSSPSASAPVPSSESLIPVVSTNTTTTTTTTTDTGLDAPPSPAVSAAGTASSGSLISPILMPAEDTPNSVSTPVPPASPPKKIFSAVDLIAQLTAEDPNYENSFMELSPEELQMSLHFGYTAPVRKTLTVDKKTESKEDLPIGKILKIQDIDILHATMDVDGDKANVLRISPNAIKLQGNGESMQTEEDDTKMNKNIESKIVLTGDSNTLRVTKINQKSDKDAKETLKLSETTKTVKMKKAKINLVSRKKKCNIIKSPVKVDNPQNGHDESMIKEEEDVPTESDHKEEEQPKNDGNTNDNKNSKMDANIVDQSEAILPKLSSERDITQLYHPPKMPKLKHKINSNNNNHNNNNNINNINESPQPASNVSLIDILTQEPSPQAQGEAQVPFRKEPELEPNPESKSKPQTEESEPSDAVVGIKNLLNHLKTDNIMPQSKPAVVSNTTSSPVTSKSPIASDKSAKTLPRKKLVKTRPFLAKRNSKSTTKQEAPSPPPKAVFPRNGSLLGEIPTNGTSKRVTSSSTSDDDAMFLGFPNAEGKSSKGTKRVKHLKAKETDISDDATPDYDETEGEDQPKLPVEKPKTVVDMEKSKIKADVNDSSPIEQEEPVSLDSNQSWTTFTEEPSNSPKPESDEVPSKELASVIVSPMETEDVSIPPESTIAVEESVENVLPAAIDTLEDSAVIQESVITNEKMNETVTSVKTETISPVKPIKSKKKSPNNKKKPEELDPVIENNNDLMDSIVHKPKLEVKEEPLKYSPNSTKKDKKISSDEDQSGGKPNEEEIPSTSKTNKKNEIENELENKNSEDVDSGTVELVTNPLEENASVTKNPDLNVLNEVVTMDQNSVDGTLDEPSSSSVKCHEKSQSPAKLVKAIEPNDDKEGPGGDLSLNVTQTDGIFTDELNDSTTPLVVPKKRGRKPKSRNQDDDSLAKKPQIDEQGADSKTEAPKDEPNPSIVTPKRRGRKPRAIEETLTNTTPISDQGDNAAAVPNDDGNTPLNTPRKRGRKPKPRISEEIVDEKPQATTHNNEQTTGLKGDESNLNTEPLVVPKKRGRKPKLRNPDESVEKEPQATNQTNEQAAIESDNKSNSLNEPLVVPKKRGRKSKSRILDESVDEKLPTTEQIGEESEASIEKQGETNSLPPPLDIPKKRGRKSRKSEEEPPAKKSKINELTSETDINNETISPSTSTSITPVPQNVFNIRLLLIRKREQLDTEEELREEGKGSGPIVCGLCLVRSTKDDWQTHLAEHYGVGWTKDQMPPFVTRSTIISEMTSYLRENKGKGLTCRLCGRKLSSGLGMVGHLEGCGTTPQRFECKYCKRMYSKLSMIQHQRNCSKRLPSSQEGESSNTEKEESIDEQKTVYSNSGRTKRKSTIKAETKLKKIRVHLQTGDEIQNGNDFDADSSDYDVNKDHESSVEYESDGVVSSLGDSEDPINSRNIKSNRSGGRVSKLGTRSKNLFSRYRDVGVVVNEKWKQFVESNYAKDPLYTNYLPSYVNLSLDEANDLLNTRQSCSMRFAYDQVKNESDWRKLKPLETINGKNEYITYLGAPIMQLEWVPLPPTITEQYLLCSLRRKMHGYTRNMDAKGHSALMMLLKCTVESGSKSESEELWPLKTKLHYGIRVPKGPVFSFAFMPSGGYMESSNRLSLLALATSSNDIQLYALPLQVTNEDKTINSSKDSEDSVIELNSFMTLRLDMNGSMQDQCTKVCWSEGSGHSLLVSGYASGNVAIWDISDTDGLNCFKSNNYCTFVPLHYFYFGERNISLLNLHYDLSGPRWLAVGTSTRKLRVYDLINCSQPTPLVGDGGVNNFFKGCLTWPPIWETISIGCSSIFQIRFTRLLLLNPCGLMYTTKSLDYVLYNARDIHYNCQENIIIAVTENGDLVFLNPREMNLEPVLHKLSYNCRAVSFTELSKLNGEQSKKDSALNANEFQQDYGIIIKPLIPVPKQIKDVYLNDARRPTNDLMTMTRLNSVRCNLNKAAHSWVAVGAEHGMLRILNFQRDKFF